MNTVQGPFWAAVRGPGLAFGVYFSHDIAVGKISLRITRSPDTLKAYAAAKQQVEDYSNGKLSLDQCAIQGSLSKIIFDLGKEQPTVSAAPEPSYVNEVMCGTEMYFSRNLNRHLCSEHGNGRIGRPRGVRISCEDPNIGAAPGLKSWTTHLDNYCQSQNTGMVNSNLLDSYV